MTAVDGPRLTVGVDIGGTFTDLVVVSPDGSVQIAKVVSTPPNYAEAVVAGLEKLGVAGSDIAHFAHGTTAATNAILTKTGASTGLITTKGFRDVLEIRRGDRGDLFNYWWRPPEPLVARHNRLAARERIGFDGGIVEPLVEEDITNAVETFKARGIESIAIVFLNSFVDDAHERRAKELAGELWPEAYVSASADIVPEILEFERTTTTVANAYVGPIIKGYLNDLLSKMNELGYDQEILVMASSGNVATLETVLEVPISTALSGLAAGAAAGAALAESVHRPNLLTIDVGGTSSDIALIWESRPRLTTEWFVEFGVPIRLPSTDIHTIGAGGGSIAYVDAGRVLHVGPASAGADPGPACYGRGGERATTTDAQAVLGRLDVALWKELYGWELSVEAAETAVRRDVAEPLGLTVAAAAEAMLDVTVNNLVEAIRFVSVQRGYDPRAFALAAYGGAGPMYAVDLARALEIPEVIIPPAPGVTSALGLLQVDLAVRTQRSVLTLQSELDPQRVDELFGEMERDALEKLTDSGYPNATVRRQVDVRYFGQSRYMTVDAPSGVWTEDLTATVVDAFSADHEREFGYVMPPHISQVEFANLRVVGEVAVQKAQIRPQNSGQRGGSTRRVFFKEIGFADTPIYRREGLSIGDALDGPAIIEQVDSTTVVPPGAALRFDEGGNLVIRA
jgi:N-methylhydantoinase A